MLAQVRAIMMIVVAMMSMPTIGVFIMIDMGMDVVAIITTIATDGISIIGIIIMIVNLHEYGRIVDSDAR